MPHSAGLIAQANARALWDADFVVSPASGDGGSARVDVTGNDVTIRNTSLRELVALAYGVESRQVTGRGNWFDHERYDIRAVSRRGVPEPEELRSRRIARLRQSRIGGAFQSRNLRQPAMPASLRTARAGSL